MPEVFESVEFAQVSENAIADNEVLAAAAGVRFRVLAYTLNFGGGANTATFKSGATAIAGPFTGAANATIFADSSEGLFETAAGAALNLALTAATIVSGHITYARITVPAPVSAKDLAEG